MGLNDPCNLLTTGRLRAAYCSEHTLRIVALLPAACGFLLIIAKYWLDNWGPLSARAQAKQQAEDSGDGEDSAYAGAMHHCGKAGARGGDGGSDTGGDGMAMVQTLRNGDADNMAWHALPKV